MVTTAQPEGMGAGRCSLMHIGAVNVEKTSSGIETSAAPLSIWAWLGKCSALDCQCSLRFLVAIRRIDDKRTK
jgi:hypothetical protein